MLGVGWGENRIDDTAWLRQSFVIDIRAMASADKRQRTDTAASKKFTDTTVGGNFHCNPPAQYTRHADPKANIIKDATGDPTKDTYHGGGRGMGRFYSESIDDNAVVIHMRFGHPEFNSVTGFMMSMYDIGQARMARTGENPGIPYTLGRVAGFVIGGPLIPLIAAARWLGQAWDFIRHKNPSKYYYLKPAMINYWGAVNIIADRISVNMGLGVTLGEDGEEDALITKQIKEQWAEMLPNIYSSDGGINIRSMTTRAQRMQYTYNKNVKEIMADVKATSPIRERLRVMNQTAPMAVAQKKQEDMLLAFKKTGAFSREIPIDPETGKQIEGKSSVANSYMNEEHKDSWFDFLRAEFRDGSKWATFKVIPSGTYSDSFSNSTKETSLKGKLNGTASSNRDKLFGLGNGNVGDDVLSGTIETVIGAAKDFIGGIAADFGVDGLAMLGGGGFADVPDHWEQSVASISPMSYDLELRTPYGNKMSIFQNLYIPFAMLLAGALPISTGKQSYNSPFIVEVFSEGRQQVRLGIIDQLSATRGVGNVGWSVDKLPLGIDVNFSIKDLSTVMHMPLQEGGMFDDDSSFTDYMAVLGALSLADQEYFIDRTKNRLNQKLRSFRSWFSVANASQHLAGLPGIKHIAMLSNATARF